MNKKEKRIVAGQVCNYIGSHFRAVDCPNSGTILHLHSVLQSYHGFTLLDNLSSTAKGVACLAAKCVFIMEKMKSGYQLARIPECLSKRKEFINQYYNFRTINNRGQTTVSWQPPNPLRRVFLFLLGQQFGAMLKRLFLWLRFAVA